MILAFGLVIRIEYLFSKFEYQSFPFVVYFQNSFGFVSFCELKFGHVLAINMQTTKEQNDDNRL